MTKRTNGKRPPGAAARRVQAKIFEGLGPHQRAEIDAACYWREHPPGSIIQAYGEAIDYVLIVQQGRARINLCSEDGRQLTYHEYGPGEIAGDRSALDGRLNAAEAIAVSSVIAAYMPAARFRKIVNDNMCVLQAELLHMTSVVRELTWRLLDLNSKDVCHRLCAYLLHMGGARGKSESWIIERAPTHEEIATQICSRRETVTRELRRLEKAGAIARHGRSLKIHTGRLGNFNRGT